MKSDQEKEADMKGRQEFYIVPAVLLLPLLLVVFWPR